MKNIYRNWILASLFSLVALTGLVSCDTDYWAPAPPNGWSSDFYDSRLTGYWELVEIDGAYVSGYATNYLFFNGSGRGLYYYYLDTRRYTETTAYWCQRSVNGASRYQINLQYQYSSSPNTMNYWFEGRDYLCMEWRNQTGYHTYVYRYYPYAPWR